MGKVKTVELRDKTRAELLAQVDELKKELSTVSEAAIAFAQMRSAR
jgi:ribosomal protein L29